MPLWIIALIVLFFIAVRAASLRSLEKTRARLLETRPRDMASSAGKMSALSLVVPVFAPVAIGSLGYAAWRVDWSELVMSFLTGPGRTSRILLVLFVVFNWKNMPFAWTVSFVLLFRVLKENWQHFCSCSSSIESSTPSFTTRGCASRPRLGPAGSSSP